MKQQETKDAHARDNGYRKIQLSEFDRFIKHFYTSDDPELL